MITNAQATIRPITVSDAKKNYVAAPEANSAVTVELTRISTCYNCVTTHRITDQSTGYSRLTHANNVTPKTFLKTQDPRNSQWKYSPTACGFTPAGQTGFDGCYSWQGNDIVFSINDNNKTCGSNQIVHSGNQSGFGGGTYTFHYSLPRFSQPYNYNDPNSDLNGLDGLCDEEVTLATSENTNDTYIWQVSANVDGPWTTFQTNPPTVTNGHLVTISEQTLSSLVGNLEDYYVRLMGDEDCYYNRSSLASKITFRKPTPKSVVFNPISPQCPGGSDGVIEITGFKDSKNNTYTVSGTLNYTLTNGSQTSNFSSSLQPTVASPIRLTSGNGLSITKGTWDVSIETQDFFGVCATSFPVTIQDPPQHAIASSSVLNQVKCDGGTGTIQVVTQGGAAPYAYFLTNSTGTPLLNSGATTSKNYTFTSVPEGVYKTNITSCGTTVTSTGSYTLDNPNPTFVIASASSTNTTCKNVNDGTINIILSGGTGTYRYAIGTGTFQNMSSNTLALTNLAKGNYLIRLLDGNNCEVQRNFTINEPTSLAITDVTASTPISCPDGLGVIQVTSSNGAGAFSYSLKENGVTVQEILNTTNRTIQFSPVKKGVYTVEVTDCSDLVSRSITLNDPQTPIAFTAVLPQNVTCIGNIDGQISVGITGGSGSYEISTGVTFSSVVGSSHTLRNLQAQQHTVTIRDAILGCVTSTNTTIGSPLPLSVNTPQISQPIICKNGTGSISVSIVNGVAPFTFKIVGKKGFTQTSNSLAVRSHTFTNLPDDTYTIEIQGCNESVSTSEIALNPPTNTTQLALQANNISCSGSSVGQIEATISGGKSPYQIRLGTNPYSNVATQPHIYTGIGPGDYQISVLDNNSCLTLGNINIPSPENVKIESVQVTTPIKCLNGTGAIQATAKGGASSYIFNLTGDKTATITKNQPTHVFTDLQSGSYQISVTSCSLSDLSATIALSEPTNTIAFSAASVTKATCTAQSNGVISATATGGLAPYAMAIDGLAPVSLVGNTQQFTNLSAATHHITLFDANNCSVDTTLNIGTSLAITATFTAQNVSCYNFNNGFVSVNPSGGDQNTVFEYSLNNGVYQSLNSFYNLSATTHSITVRDANATNCSWNGNFDISQPNAIVIDQFEVTKTVSCFGRNDASLTVASSGGPSLHHYTLLEGVDTISSVSNVATHIFSQLTAGDYRLLVSSDAVGCGLEKTISITEPDPLNVSVSISDFNGESVSCSNANDGQVTFSSTGGTYPHTYSTSGLANKIISNDLSSVSFSGFSKGANLFSMQDKNGCTFDTTITFTAPDSLITSYKKSIYPNGLNISCNQATDGFIYTFAQGGTAPYRIELGSVISTLDSAVFSTLRAGNYLIKTTDKNGCSALDSAMLLEPKVLAISSIEIEEISGYNLACKGDSNGVANITAQGGIFPYHVFVDDDSLFVVNDTVFLITKLFEGAHTIDILDVAGCHVTENFTLTTPSILALDPSKTKITKPDCGNDPTGSIEVKAIGGVPLNANGNYNYTLIYKNPPSNLPFPVEQSKVADSVIYEQLIGGSYSIIVSDLNGCTNQQGLNVNTNQQLTVSTVGDILTCKGDTNGNGEVIVQGGTEPYHITMYSNDVFMNEYLNVDAIVPLQINDLPEGKYNLQIVDANGCGYLSDDYFFEIQAPEKTLLLSHSSTNVLCADAKNGTATLIARGGWNNTPYTFGLDASNLQSFDSVFTDLAPGNYTYFVQDSAGCIASTNVEITEPLPLVSTINNETNPRCFGETSGSFEFSTTGGTAPYLFSLDSTTWITQSIFDSLGNGSYTLISRDSHNCITYNQVTLTEPDSLKAILANQVSTDCLQQTGSATASVTGGNFPYTFKWVDENNQVVSTSLIAQNLGAKHYSFSTIDQLGCTDTLTVLISFTNTILADVNILQNVTCFNKGDGMASLQISEIERPYLINWDNNTSSDTTQNLNTGSHSVIVTDVDGCTQQLDFEITQPDSLIIDLQTTDPICNSICSGTILTSVTGGTGSYAYTWSNESTSASLSNLCAGDYLLSIVDENGCIATKSATIIDPPAPSLPVADSIFPVCDGNNAFINLDEYSHHLWTFPNGDMVTSSSINTNIIGDYNVSVVDEKQCVITANFKLVPSKDVFKAEFILPKETYVGDTIVCVNLTKPYPENVFWSFDTATTTQISSDKIYQLLVFKTEGLHELSIKAQIGECTSTQYKFVNVYNSTEKSNDISELGYIEKGIKYLNIYPNPNDGVFQCEVELHKQNDIKIIVVDELGNTYYTNSESQITSKNLTISINNPQSGGYILIVQTNDDVKSMHFIVR